MQISARSAIVFVTGVLAAGILGGCQLATPSAETSALGTAVKAASDTDPSLLTLYPNKAALSADAIMARAHAVAGGAEWVRPQSLVMDGYGVFYKDGEAATHERHRMWRVYAADKSDAHRVDGKVRIRSEKNGVAVIDLSFDGTTTYTAAGPQPKSEADKRWASNFGFGVIRHAFDPGYSLSRLPDDLIDGRAAYIIDVRDLAGGNTIFGIAQDNAQILKVGFDTARGWHERIYSDFYSNPNDAWVQPGRVRLYYNGVKANEVIWTSYQINMDVPPCLFILPAPDGCEGLE